MGSLFGGGGGVDNSASNAAAAQQAADEAARQQNINQGTQEINTLFSPYNQDYYDNLGTQYTNYYEPQLDTQYKQAQDQQAYNLADQGLSNSSAAGKAASDLAKQYSTTQQQILGNANSYENQAKQSVAGVQNDLQSQLNASADPTQINANALNRIAIQPVNSFTPLANAFANVAGAVGGAAANTTAITGQSPLASLFGSPFGQQGQSTSSSSSKIVGS